MLSFPMLYRDHDSSGGLARWGPRSSRPQEVNLESRDPSGIGGLLPECAWDPVCWDLLLLLFTGDEDDDVT
jgi:hypothetical protein